MPIQKTKVNRAKLFLAFDALKGLRSSLQKKETIYVEKKELLQDHLDTLNWKIHQIIPGQILEVIYYKDDRYIKVTGMLAKKDFEYTKTIQIVTTTIPILDIIKINFL